MAFGLRPASIMSHVMDAIHNECKKASAYPGEYMPSGNRKDRLVELGDVQLQVEHLRHLAGITSHELAVQVIYKTEQLERAVAVGDMVLIDGLMYRRGVRGKGAFTVKG
jgi:hypothetical protein